MAQKIRGITIDLGVDTSKLTKGLKDANSALKSTQTQLKDVNKLLKLDPKNTTLLKQKTELLNDAIGDTRKKLEEQKKLMEELKKAGDTTDNRKQQQALERDIEATKKQLQDLEKEQKNMPSTFTNSLDTVGTKMEAFGGKMENFGNKMMGITAGIGAVAAASVAAFNEVDEAYDTVVAKTGASGSELSGLKEIVDEIAGEMPADFDEIGEAVGEVNTRFKLSGDELKDVATAFLKFSKLNGTSVSTSIDNVQKAMAAFGINTEDTVGFLDRLNYVGQQTGASVDKIATSLTTNAATLQEMGMSAEQAATFLGQLETSGIDASTVLTGLKKAMAKATAEGKTLPQALGELQDKMANASGSTEALTEAYELFGNRAGGAIYNACKNGQLDFKNLAKEAEKSITTVNGTFENTVDATDEAKIAINKLKIAGSKLGGEILKDLTPVIKDLSEWLGKITKKWNSLTDEQKKNIMKMAGVVAAIGPVLTIIGKLTTGIGSLIKIGKGVPGVLKALGGHPVLTAIGLGAAAIAAFAGFMEQTKTQTIETIRGMSNLGTEFDELSGKINTRKTEWAELTTASDESRKAIDLEASSYEELAKKYDSLLDPQGNVKQGYENEADTIKTTLAEAYDIEYGNIDTLIKKYGSLEKAIDHLNIKRKADSYLEAYSGEYTKAQTGLNDAYTEYKTAESDFNNAKTRYDAAVQDFLDTGKFGYNEISAFIGELSSLEGGLAGDEAASKVDEVAQKLFGGKNAEEIKANIDRARELYSALVDYQKTVPALTDAKNAWESYRNTIMAYDELRAASIKGDEQAINDASIKIANHFQYAENSTKESLGRQVTDAEEKLNEYRRLVNVEGSGITQDMVNEQARMVELAKAEAAKFTEVGKTVVDSTKKGITDNQGSLYATGEQGGKDYGDGLINGMTAKQRAVYDKARELGMNVRTAQMEALDEHSPSKVAQWVGEMYGEGLVRGLNSQINPVINASRRLANAANYPVAASSITNNITPNITVNAAAGQSANSIADAVIAKLNNSYRQTTKTFA